MCVYINNDPISSKMFICFVLIRRIRIGKTNIVSQPVQRKIFNRREIHCRRRLLVLSIVCRHDVILARNSNDISLSIKRIVYIDRKFYTVTDD